MIGASWKFDVLKTKLIFAREAKLRGQICWSLLLTDLIVFVPCGT